MVFLEQWFLSAPFQRHSWHWKRMNETGGLLGAASSFPNGNALAETAIPESYANQSIPGIRKDQWLQ